MRAYIEPYVENRVVKFRIVAANGTVLHTSIKTLQLAEMMLRADGLERMNAPQHKKRDDS